MTRLLLFFIAFVFAGNLTYSQDYTPMELSKLVFGKEKFPNLRKHSTGEYKGHPNGLDLPKLSSRKFLLLGETNNKAVIAMTVLDTNGKGVDTYLHFEKDKIWKLHAFRALALNGMTELINEELEKMTPQQLDGLTNDPNKKKMSPSLDYRFELGNIKLQLALDDSIINHFLKNKIEFERLKDEALKDVEIKNENSGTKLIEKLKPDYKKLFITSVSFGDTEFGNCLSFLIGGILDNTVGYLYVKDPKDLPVMNASNIIMLREIGNGWYLYKTT